MCRNSFSKETDLTTHVNTHSKEEDFNCEICAKNLHQETDLREHEVIHIPKINHQQTKHRVTILASKVSHNQMSTTHSIVPYAPNEDAANCNSDNIGIPDSDVNKEPTNISSKGPLDPQTFPENDPVPLDLTMAEPEED